MAAITPLSVSADEIWGGHLYYDGGSWGNRSLYPGETLTLEMPWNFYLVIANGQSHLVSYEWWYDGDGGRILSRASAPYNKCTIWGETPSTGDKVKLYLSYTHYSDGYTSVKYHVYYFDVTVKTPTNGYLTLATDTEGGAVNAGTVVKLSSNVSDADIYYTTDEWSYPTPNSTKYTSAGITINSNTTLRARAMKSGGYYMSDILEVTYTLKIPVNSITLNATSVNLAVGGTTQLTATVKPTDATDKTVTWSSDNESVATVNSSGKVTAISAGNATISCMANDGSGVEATCNVNVSAWGVEINETNFPDENFRNFLLNYNLGSDGVFTDNEISQITTLYLANKNIERLKGIEYFTALTYLRCERNNINGDAMDELIDCLPQSDSSNIIYVYDNTHNDEKNVCTKPQVAAAKDKGWTPLYVISENSFGFYSGSDILITSITLNKTSLSLETGENETLTPTILPTNATNQNVTWSSSNTSVAAVTSSGKVTAVAAGSATITCKANDESGVQATCSVTVTEPIILVTKITLSKTALSLEKGKTENLTATLLPYNATDKTVTWSSSDDNIAIVDNNGKVTALSKGNATITCKANDESGVQATCTVIVTNPKPTAVTLPDNASVVKGETLTLIPELTPTNAETILTWTSDDETVATVNSEGVVQGVGIGQTYINVETDNGKMAWCKLTVVAPEPTKIELPKNASVYIGETIALTPTFIPADAISTLTWQSDDERIAKVSVDGVVTGITEGLTVITVTSANGITSNPCKVKVMPDPSGINDVTVSGRAGNIPVYSVSGQRIVAPRKGVNIVNGKKVVVR